MKGGIVMKIMRSIFFIGAITYLSIQAHDEPFKVILKAKWHDLDSNPQRVKTFGGKWVIAGSITFKKRTQEVIFLNQLQLTWEGENIDQLAGSLYEKNDMSAFLPIEKYLVCDSRWKKSTQQLVMKFNRTFTLGAVNTFYLVLTVPDDVEKKLKQGRFKLEQVGLPTHYRQYVKGRKLSIALSELNQNQTTT